eukprot:1675995-Amphidinium_carterae.1
MLPVFKDLNVPFCKSQSASKLWRPCTCWDFRASTSARNPAARDQYGGRGLDSLPRGYGWRGSSVAVVKLPCCTIRVIIDSRSALERSGCSGKATQNLWGGERGCAHQ